LRRYVHINVVNSRNVIYKTLILCHTCVTLYSDKEEGKKSKKKLKEAEKDLKESAKRLKDKST
jgi:hypothetical protein